MSSPDWSEDLTEIFEKCIDYVFLADWNSLTFENLVKQGIDSETLIRNFSNLKELQIELIEYWAWKDTHKINARLIQIQNPFLRLITLLRFSFQNNRYLKFYNRVRDSNLPEKARQSILEVDRIKYDFLVKLLVDRGLSQQRAIERVDLIRPVYYGWASEKEDVIRSEIHKFDILGLFRDFLFPEFFSPKKFTVKDF